MNLYIQIDNNNQPYEHPILEDNLMQVIENFDPNNLPPGIARFERVPRPTLKTYEIPIQFEPTYEWVDGIVKDVWHIRDMTEEEKQTKINAVKESPHLNGWVFLEDKCIWCPPTPRPDDGKEYFWNEETLSWQEVIPE